MTELEIFKQFQGQLLTLLDSELPPETLKETLLAACTDPHLREYIRSMDPDMILIARDLIKAWGVKCTLTAPNSY